MAKKWYSSLFKENIYGIGIQALTFGGGVLFTIIFPNLLGKEGFGYYSLVIGVAAIAQFLTDFGIPTAALRFIPEGLKKGVAWKYFRTMFEWRMILSVAAAALLFLGTGIIAAAYHSPAMAEGVQWGAVFLLFYSLFVFIDNVFVGLKKTHISFLMNLTFQGGRALFPIAIFVLYRPDYIGVLIGVAIACGIAALPAAFAAFLEPALRKGREEKFDLTALKSYIRYGSVYLFAFTTLQWSDILLIGLFRPVAEVSLYRIAWLWATAAVLCFPVSSRVFMSAHAYENEEKSRKILDLSLNYSFAFIFLVIAGVILVAEQFLLIIYGADSGFGGAYPVMVILSLLVLEMVLNNITAGLLWGKGNIQATTRITVVTAICQMAALFLLAPSYGILGAAAGVVLVRVAAALAQTMIALKRLSLRIPARYVYGPALCALITVAVLLPIRGYTFPLPLALGYGISVVVVYGLLAVALKVVDVRGFIRIVGGAVSH